MHSRRKTRAKRGVVAGRDVDDLRGAQVEHARPIVAPAHEPVEGKVNRRVVVREVERRRAVRKRVERDEILRPQLAERTGARSGAAAGISPVGNAGQIHGQHVDARVGRNLARRPDRPDRCHDVDLGRELARARRRRRAARCRRCRPRNRRARARSSGGRHCRSPGRRRGRDRRPIERLAARACAAASAASRRAATTAAASPGPSLASGTRSWREPRRRGRRTAIARAP